MTEMQSSKVSSSAYSNKAQVHWINNARIFACFIVVFLHVSASVVTGIPNTDSPYWWIGNIFDSFSRWCIPIFVMLSGMLFLDTAKDEPILDFYNKRISRIFIPLLFWTIFSLAFQYFGALFIHGEHISIWSLASSILSGVPYYHLWYLYMIVGIYLFVPFFRKIIRQSSSNELLFCCIALFAFSIAGNGFMLYYTANNLPATFKFVFYLPYFLAGYLIFWTDVNPSRWILYGIFILSAALTSIGYYYSLGTDGSTNGYFYSFISITVVPMSISVLFLLKRFVMPVINSAVSNKLALLSLGIYLIHAYILDVLTFFGITAKSLNPLLSIPVITIMVFLLSLAAAIVISKVPIIKRIIGLQ